MSPVVPPWEPTLRRGRSPYRPSDKEAPPAPEPPSDRAVAALRALRVYAEVSGAFTVEQAHRKLEGADYKFTPAEASAAIGHLLASSCVRLPGPDTYRLRTEAPR